MRDSLLAIKTVWRDGGWGGRRAGGGGEGKTGRREETGRKDTVILTSLIIGALQEELARMQREHDAKLEEMRLAEEEKNKELEQLRQASKDLEDQKNLLETQLSEMNAQYANDVRSLNDLGLVKRCEE